MTRRAWLLPALILGLGSLVAAGEYVRFHRAGGAASSSARSARPEPPEIELRFHVQVDRAADYAFLDALDRFVAALRSSGTRIGRVLPEPRAALVGAPGLDEAKVAHALTDLPLEAAGPITPAGEVRVRITEAAAREATETAMARTIATVRERVMSARPCEGCAPAVIERQGMLTVRLPWIDDITESRIRAAVEAKPPLPAPVTFMGHYTVEAERAPSL